MMEEDTELPFTQCPDNSRKIWKPEWLMTLVDTIEPYQETFNRKEKDENGTFVRKSSSNAAQSPAASLLLKHLASPFSPFFFLLKTRASNVKRTDQQTPVSTRTQPVWRTSRDPAEVRTQSQHESGPAFRGS
ncbi:hypothetical protein WJX77_006744 [Trebouxia sp. C0004]